MSDKEIIKVDDVFSTSLDKHMNYVNREYVDDVLLEELIHDNHIVLHGGSKQGKTWLKLRHLCQSPSDSVYCTSAFTLEILHKAIVRNLISSEKRQETRVSGNKSTEALAGEFGAKLLVNAQTKGEKISATHKEDVVTYHYPELDWLNINQVANVVQEHIDKEYIVLEEFHLLPHETQKAFAQELKAFQERAGIKFVIIGVWIENDRIQRLASDINLRVKSINVGRWEKEDLRKVPTQGADILNLQLPVGFAESVANRCLGNVALAQKVCLKACIQSNIAKKEKKPQKIRSDFNTKDTVRVLAKEFSSTDGWIISLLETRIDILEEMELKKACLKTLLHFPAMRWRGGVELEKIMRIFETYSKHKGGDGFRQAQKFFETIEYWQKRAEGPIFFEFDRKYRRIHCVETGYRFWRMQKKRDTVIQIVDENLEDQTVRYYSSP